MPRFVILQHETPRGYARPRHWDLMFEQGESLLTWSVEDEPQVGTSLRAEQLPDHRRKYLDYEGPVSDDRGTVSRWDSGTYELRTENDGDLTLTLAGERLRCEVTLSKQDDDDSHWTIVYS